MYMINVLVCSTVQHGQEEHRDDQSAMDLQALSMYSIPMERCLLPASCPVVMTIALTASMPLVYKYQQKQLRASTSPFMHEHPS